MDVVKDTRAHFFLGGDPDSFFDPLDQARKLLEPNYHPVASAFQHNLRAAWSSLALPVTLAASAVQDTYFQMIRIQEAIRTLPLPGEEANEDADKEADLTASTLMNEFTDSGEGRNILAKKVAHFLSGLRQAPPVNFGAAELLRQGVVLIWGALEVLSRDLFVALLNAEPDRCKLLAQSTETKRRFELKSIPLDLLFLHGYDLSSKMGILLADMHDLADLSSIKGVYAVLFAGNGDLQKSLAHKDLWILNQRRHLIVHRRGIVDRQYLKNTGDTAVLGEVLTVSPDEIKTYFGRVRDAGVAMLDALKEPAATTA